MKKNKLKSGNILILDDDKITISMITSVLKEKYNIYYTTKYKEAIKILERIKIDVILLDVIMPTINGFDFLEIVRGNSKISSIPIIFITSKNNDEIIEKFEKLSASYIFKPFDANNIKNKITDCIKKTNEKSRESEEITDKSKTKELVNNTALGNILIVDDEQMDIDIIKGAINGNHNIFNALKPAEAIEILRTRKVDLILLDVMMPEMDGFEFCRKIKNDEAFKGISVIFITVKDKIESIVEGFKSGGVDFISKPFNREELLARINTHLEIKRLNDELKEKNRMLEDRKAHLEYLVEKKTEKIGKITSAMVTVLETANLYNDEDTGKHIKRVTLYALLIAEALNMPLDFINKIKIYTSIHDIGKIGISHSILKKCGKLTPEEFEKMKEHVKIGYKIISDREIDDVAKNIVLYHHEKWDGSGYLEGLKGEEIPLEARIVAIADVYDALTTKRVYKEAFSHEKAEEIMNNEKNKHFDSHLIDLFFVNKEKLLDIKKRFS